ncbi:MAG: Zn(2+)-responsive transcriptional regulator [Gemmatimonadota bacterium]|nr:MAG: Zn(2+)-responsive transcriptional regulator [Gemmatimonadota bacterium]
MAADPGLTIGALADAAGVGRETVRFYERKGLLADPPRTDSGYRSYPPESVERLRFIRRAQGLGFTLEEISELLALRVDEVAACGTVEARAREKLAKVAQKLTELRRMKRALERLVDACEAREPTSDCPILEELEER